MGDKQLWVFLILFLTMYDKLCSASDTDDDSGESSANNCSLTIWQANTDVTGRLTSVLNGDTVTLLCDARCSGSDYTPALKWFNQNLVVIEDFPGRVFSVPTSSRHQVLYIKSVNQDDTGKYMCGGLLGKWTTAHVTLDIETQAREFTQADP